MIKMSIKYLARCMNFLTFVFCPAVAMFFVFLTTSFYLLTTVFAEVKIHPNAGTTSAAFLKLGLGSRAVAMADAFGAISDDITALYYNPAGLARLKKNEIHLTHNESFESIRHDFVGYADVYKKYTLAAAVYGITMPSDLERRSGVNEGDPFEPYTGSEGSFGANDVAVHFACARKLRNNLSVGSGVKVIQQTIDSISAYGIAADFGVLYKYSRLPMSVGVALQNIGTPIKFIEKSYYPPFNIKLAGALNVNRYVTAALDLNKPIDNFLSVSLGCELKPSEFLFVRCGYKYRTEGQELDDLAGMAAGVGLNFNISKHMFRIDYAFTPYGVLGNSQRFSITTFFEKSGTKRKLVVKPAVVDSAEKQYAIVKTTVQATVLANPPAVFEKRADPGTSQYDTKVTSKIISSSGRKAIYALYIDCPESDLYNIDAKTKVLPDSTFTVKIIEKLGKGKIYKEYSFEKSVGVRISNAEISIKLPKNISKPLIRSRNGKKLRPESVIEEEQFIHYKFKFYELEPFTVER